MQPSVLPRVYNGVLPFQQEAGMSAVQGGNIVRGFMWRFFLFQMEFAQSKSTFFVSHSYRAFLDFIWLNRTRQTD